MNQLEELAEAIIYGRPTNNLWDKINGLDPEKYKEVYNRIKEQKIKDDKIIVEI